MSKPPKRPAEDSVERRHTWNLVSFAVIGISGVAINLLIARFYPPWALGVFNTILAIFIVAGQFGALGVQYSMIYHVPIALARGEQVRPILLAGLIVATLGASGVVAFLSIAQFVSHQWSDDRSYSEGLTYALVGIWFFPLNKIMLGYLNGTHRVAAYAVGSALRYVLAVFAVIFLIAYDYPGTMLSSSLAISETLLALGLCFVCLATTARQNHHGVTDWLKAHLSFGARALPAGIVQELNTRIDVLVLSAMSSAHSVGIYSMASIFAEGLYQMVMTLRIALDPILAPLVAQKQWTELARLIRRTRWLAYVVTFTITLIAMAVYPFALELLLQKSDFTQSWPVFGILAAGIALSAGYIPLSGLLQQAGYPGSQSLLLTLVMVTNLVGNVLLIPYLDALGAALATAISQISFVFWLIFLVKRKLALSI